MRIVKTGSFWETLRWTIRSWKVGYPLIDNVQDWALTDMSMVALSRELANNWARWHFLAPFFASHGLYIYEYIPDNGTPATPPKYPLSQHTSSEGWPWARRAYKSDRELDFEFYMALRIWAARDRDGHEVVIRLASGPKTTDELRAFQRLNTEEARRDPRNHTLPILKYLVFNGMVFVVMPRWQTGPFESTVSYDTVSELCDVAEAFYEGLEFLHEKRIAHRDIYESNTVMNLLRSLSKPGHKMRTIGEVRYAFIDFDVALVLPEGADISTVSVEREIRVPLLDIGLKPGLCNPFKDDVLCLTAALERTVRVAEGVVPRVGDFFDCIRKCDYDECPSAAEVLRDFRALRANMTEMQLKQPPAGGSWENGQCDSIIIWGANNAD
ncbi:other/AgaK1 protein kinase [Ephemerocybe angulata]|uniref:Other/AgaK1 protein kinase n=1 Tax=Ephemerocybe angulata TaxID=980116 RepID=A0A8H6IBV8_9AGAR|nr:other/AgaK1 protein kinase [Tulosesus angulatus]